MRVLKSREVFAVLLAAMVAIKLYDIVFNPVKAFQGRTAEFSGMEIVATFILGTLGLYMYKRIGLPDFDNPLIRKRKTVLTSIGYGLLLGSSLVAFDSVARIGDMSVGWPLSIIFYIWGAISSEVIFRLFAISLIVWLFSHLILRKRFDRQVYWAGAAILSLLAAGGMLAAFSDPSIPLNHPGDVLLSILGALVFSSEMVAFMLLRRYGFLANLAYRLSFYLVWHVIWPPLFY